MQRAILVIDSDPAPAKRIENILASEGYTISFASTPEQILSSLKETNPSLIFASLTMPDGLEICKRIHNMTAFSKIPLIALTSVEKGKIRYEPEYGIIDSINRSFSADELILKTETVLSIKEITESSLKETPRETIEKPQLKPVEEEDIFAYPEEQNPVPEKKMEPKVSLKEDFMPVHDDMKRFIDKSFEPRKEAPPPEEPPIHEELLEEPETKKKRGLLIPVIILLILVISAAAYFAYQRFGKEIRTTANQLVNKVLPSKPAQPVQTAKPAPPAQPVQPEEPQKPLAQEPKASPQTPTEVKVEQKPEAQKVVTEKAPKTASMKESHFYSAQVGAYKETVNAEALVERLKSKGYDAFTLSITKGNENFHKVMVGKFEDKKKAQEIISDLKDKENLKAILYISGK